MRTLLHISLALVVLALGGLAFIHSGIYNVTAMDKHSALGHWVLHTTMENSVQARVSDIEVPANLSDETMIRRGARAYDQLCAACHLKPGLDGTVLRKGLNPKPPALTAEGHFGPAEQFWVIKNGIKMSGMPAWGLTHEDKALWEITAFLQRLPDLSEAQYQSLIKPDTEQTATTHDGHKGHDGHDHDHGDMSAMMAESHDANGGQSKQAPQDHHGSTEENVKGKEKDDHYADGHTH